MKTPKEMIGLKAFKWAMAERELMAQVAAGSREQHDKAQKGQIRAKKRFYDYLYKLEVSLKDDETVEMVTHD